VLALLRSGSGRRPRIDPALAGGLRAWLEDAAAVVVAARGEDAPPLVLGLGRMPVSAPGIPLGATGHGALEPVVATLVHVLFRQIVTTGSVDDPLADALDALSVDPWQQELVAQVRGLTDVARAALRRSLRRHVTNLVDLTPRFAPGWLPRTDDRIAIPLAGGRVVLGGTFDLLVGVPDPGKASLCALGLTVVGPSAAARRALRHLALLETLRSGAPPYRLALLHSECGRSTVEDVTEELLLTVTADVAQWLAGMAGTGG
jgi:hypothetical protein